MSQVGEVDAIKKESKCNTNKMPGNVLTGLKHVVSVHGP